MQNRERICVNIQKCLAGCRGTVIGGVLKLCSVMQERTSHIWRNILQRKMEVAGRHFENDHCVLKRSTVNIEIIGTCDLFQNLVARKI